MSLFIEVKVQKDPSILGVVNVENIVGVMPCTPDGLTSVLTFDNGGQSIIFEVYEDILSVLRQGGYEVMNVERRS